MSCELIWNVDSLYLPSFFTNHPLHLIRKISPYLIHFNLSYRSLPHLFQGRGGAAAFLRGAVSDDESDDDGPKVVKSAKDKRLEEMEATVKVMDNASKINDWVAINNGE